MSPANRVYVIGGGGHAKVVVQAIQAMGRVVATVFDDNPAVEGRSVGDAPIVCPIASIETYPPLATVIAIGNNERRRFFAEQFDLEWMTVIHPHAFVDRSARLGRGVVVLPGSVIQVDSRVGNHAIINTAATVDHDCTLGDYVHLAPGTHLGGGVVIGDGTMLGIGAVAIPNTRIGPWTTVGAGAVVTSDLPDRVTAVGIPARVRDSACPTRAFHLARDGMEAARNHRQTP